MASRAGGIRAGRAFVEIGANDAGLQAAIARIRSRFASLSAVLAATGGGMVAAGTSMLGALAWPLKLAANMETAQVGFEVLTGSAQTAADLVQQLNVFAAETPFQTDELNTAARMLLAFGTSAGDVVSELRMLGDVSSAIGAPLGEIAEIYGKARVQGRLFMEDINQLTGRGIPIITQLANQFGVTEDKVRELVSSGKVNFGNLQQAMQDMTGAGGQFTGMMARQSQTLAGRWSTLKDNIAAAIRPLGQALLPVVGSLVSDLTTVAEMIGTFIEKNQGAAIAVAGVAVSLVAMGGVLIGVGGGMWALVAATGVLTGLLTGLAGLVVSPWVLGGAAIVGLLVHFDQMKTVLGTVGDALGGVSDWFAGFGGIATQAWQGVTNALAAGDMEAAFAVVTSGLSVAWTKLMSELTQSWGSTVTDIAKVGGLGFLEIQNLWTTATTSMAQMGDWFATSMVNSLQWVIGFFDRLQNVIGQVVEKVASYIPGTEGFYGLGDGGNARIAELEAEYQARAKLRQEAMEQNRQGSGVANAARGDTGQAIVDARRDVASEYFSTLDQMQSESVAAAEQRLRDAQRNFNQITSDAEQAAAAKAKATQEKVDEAVGKAKGAAESSTKSVGSFSLASAAQQFGFGPAADRTAKATERTAKATEDIADKADSGGLVFG